MSASTESQRSVFSRQPKSYERTRTTSISVRKTEFEPNENKKCSPSLIARFWNRFDDKFMRPLLTASKPTLIETMPDFCGPCARLFTSYDQMDATSPHNISSNSDEVEDNVVYDLSYTEVGNGRSMVCSTPLIDPMSKAQEYNSGFTS